MVTEGGQALFFCLALVSTQVVDILKPSKDKLTGAWEKYEACVGHLTAVAVATFLCSSQRASVASSNIHDSFIQVSKRRASLLN